jgi:hypothetical protein
MGGKTQQSSQQVSIPPEVLARYNSVNAQAQQTAQTPFQQYSSDPNAFVSPMTTAQNAGLQQTANYANAAQPGIQQGMDMTQAASGAANPGDLGADQINKYMSPYTSNVTNQMTALMNQQNQQAQWRRSRWHCGGEPRRAAVTGLWQCNGAGTPAGL